MFNTYLRLVEGNLKVIKTQDASHHFLVGQKAEITRFSTSAGRPADPPLPRPPRGLGRL